MARLLHLTTTSVSLDWLLAPQLEAFADAGYEVLTASAPGDHVAALEARGIAHRAIPSLSRNMDLRSDLNACRELRALFDDVQPTILHTHNPKPGVLGRMLGKATQVPIVVNTVHGLYTQPGDRFLRRASVLSAERVAASCSDAELVQNPEDVATLQGLGVPGRRVHFLGNGIDLDRFSPTVQLLRAAAELRGSLGIGLSTPVVGVIGRLVWEKGYRELFDAIETLKVQRPEHDFAVVVVGPGEEGKHGAVDRAAKEHMRCLGVHFVGRQDLVEQWHSLFDVFVLPSHREGFPRAAMEASAMQTPVIATDIRGCRQVVAHERSGLLVPVRDSLSLADAIARLLDDPVLRRRFGVAARRRALAEFDQHRVIARTEAVYRSLLRARGLTPPSYSISDRYSDSIDLVAAEASNPAALAPAA